MNNNSWQYMCDYLDGRITHALKNASDQVQTDVLCAYVEHSLNGIVTGSKSYEKKTIT
jgi:hypothetical protein